MDAVRDCPSGLTSTKVLAVVAGLSVGATVGYMLYRHVNATSADPDPNPDWDCELSRMSVPVEIYRNLSRHQSQFLDLVVHKSGAQVRVASDSEDPAAVSFLLRGSEEQVLLARCILENLVSDCEPMSEVLVVPQTSLGRIIGRGGESLKRICRTTGAKVSCSKEKSGATETVTVSGSRREVQQAKELILEKVSEDVTVRTMISRSSAQRLKRGQTVSKPKMNIEDTEARPQYLNNNGPLSVDGDGDGNKSLRPSGTGGEPAGLLTEDGKEDSLSTEPLSETFKFEIPSPDLSFQPGEHLEVYVSAVENPSHFWIQILGVRSLQLDQLLEEMTRFYSSAPPEQGVETLVVGDIVAAPYQDHGTWNRARVLGVLESGLIDVYYVDFGDNGELSRESLQRLRSDFLSLPFQAIECSLAGVRPKGETWTEEALERFDQLTHCAQWRPLQAKLCSYSHSDVSSWPSVKLYDNDQGKPVDIGEELIRQDQAVSSSEELNGRPAGEGEALGLQRMLEDVIGASSELSLSCISLSEAASVSGSADDVMEDEPL